MPKKIDPFILRMLDGAKNIILDIDDPEVLQLSKEIAFYDAMLSSAKKSDLDGVDEDFLAYIERKLKKARKKYMKRTDKIVDM